jgi:hypothetical protein
MSRDRRKKTGPLTEAEWGDFAEGRGWKELEGYLRDRRDILMRDCVVAVRKGKNLTEGEDSAESIAGQIKSVEWLLAIPTQLPSMMKQKRIADEAKKQEGNDNGGE